MENLYNASLKRAYLEVSTFVLGRRIKSGYKWIKRACAGEIETGKTLREWRSKTMGSTFAGAPLPCSRIEKKTAEPTISWSREPCRIVGIFSGPSTSGSAVWRTNDQPIDGTTSMGLIKICSRKFSVDYCFLLITSSWPEWCSHWHLSIFFRRNEKTERSRDPFFPLDDRVNLHGIKKSAKGYVINRPSRSLSSISPAIILWYFVFIYEMSSQRRSS